MNSNVTVLTQQRAAWAVKKKKKQDQKAEILFDDDARRFVFSLSLCVSLSPTPEPREYLTGFRKRNIIKKEARVTKAKERERLERLELRQEVRFHLLSHPHPV